MIENIALRRGVCNQLCSLMKLWLFFTSWHLQSWRYSWKNGDGDGNKDVELMTSSESVSGRWQSWQAKWEWEDQESGAEEGLTADFGETFSFFWWYRIPQRLIRHFISFYIVLCSSVLLYITKHTFWTMSTEIVANLDCRKEVVGRTSLTRQS